MLSVLKSKQCNNNNVSFTCSPGRKVASSFPDELLEFFNLLNPSSRNMALRSTQPLTEMSTRNLPGGKG
jgi:hypothetical protein